MDYAEAARNYVQDDAVVFLQFELLNFIRFCSGLGLFILFIFPYHCPFWCPVRPGISDTRRVVIEW